MKNRNIVTIFATGLLACFGVFAANKRSSGSYSAAGRVLPQVHHSGRLQALQFLTSGAANTGLGWRSLYSTAAGSFNTGVGAGALVLNTTNDNTAVGAAAMLLNTSGTDNTAVGTGALEFNDAGSNNVGVGAFALRNTTSGANAALGFEALEDNTSHFTNVAVGVFAAQNTDANFNTAVGGFSLRDNTGGSKNTAVGAGAIESGDGGNDNTAVGYLAGNNLTGSGNNCFGHSAGTSITTGANNVVVGNGAGGGLTSGSDNIVIGAIAEAGPFANFDNTVFINSIFGEPVSDPGSQVPVYVDQFNVVGVFNTSSRKLKHDIKPMDKASETLYQFKPVTFKYNSDWKGTTQYGLIAEEVAEANPQLVVHGKNGEIMGVHYEQINNMLLNEFLKEHKKIEELQASIAQQQKGMRTHCATQRAGRANPKSERAARDEQTSGESSREQTLAVVHHNYGIIICS